MIPWWVAVLTYVAGQLIAVGAFALCSSKEPEKHKYIK